MSLLVPIATWLIVTFGWRATFVVIAAALLVVMLPLSLWVVRDSPEALGLAPDGEAAPVASAGSVAGERTSVGQAVQTLPFWQLATSLSTCGFTMALLSAHGLPMLTDHGYQPMFASWAVAVLGGSSVAFALVLGTMADRFGGRPVLAWIYGGRAIAILALFMLREHPVALLVVAALSGATMGGTFAMTSALTAGIFGRYSVGSVFGLMFLVHQVGAALGSWLGGVAFEMTGGYGAIFAISSAALMLAALSVLMVDDRPRGAPTALLTPARAGH